MGRDLSTAVAVLALACLVGCTEGAMDTADDSTGTAAADNALLAEWTGPYSGVPAFDRMELAALEAALESGMAMNLEEVDRVAENPDPPTFDNTIVALEGAGRDLSRVFTHYGIWGSNLSSRRQDSCLGSISFRT